MMLSYKEDSEDLFSQLNNFISEAGTDASVSSVVTTILADIRVGGDKAVLSKTAEFDGVNLKASDMRVSQEELKNALNSLTDAEKGALEESISNVTYFHQQSLLKIGRAKTIMQELLVKEIIQSIV